MHHRPMSPGGEERGGQIFRHFLFFGKDKQINAVNKMRKKREDNSKV